MKFLATCHATLTRLSEERFYLAVITFMAVIVAAVVTPFALSLHWNFLTIACDTAAFQNAIANTLHGEPFRDTAYDGPNLLGLHSTFILLLIAPLYAFWPSADMLFTLQVWAVYSTVIPLYLVAVEIVRRPLAAFLLAATVLASPVFLQMATAPFHPETWILAAVLWSCYFYRRDRPRAFWISFAIAVTSGELAALIYIALGLSLVLVEDGVAWRRRYGIRAVVAGLGWFVLSTQVLVPLMRAPEQHNLVAYHYSNWNANSAGQLIAALLHDPGQVVFLLLSPVRWGHVFWLVGLPLVLAFFSHRTLLLLLPFPVYFLMSNQEFYLYFHAYFYVFALLAGYVAAMIFLERWEMSSRRSILMLVGILLLNGLLLCPVLDSYISLGAGRSEELNRALHEQFALIPAEAVVYSPHRYSAYLSNRPDLVMGDLNNKEMDFKAMLDANYATTKVRPEEIDYIVTDIQNDQCGWRHGGNPEASKLRADTVDHLLQSGEWAMVWNQDNVAILKRKKAGD